VKPAHEEATGRKRKEMKDPPLGRKQWKALIKEIVWDG
jgi:hypothetical protein